MKVKFFKNFSINLHNFFKANGERPVSKGVHPNGKTYWVYVHDERLDELLGKWAEGKEKALERKSKGK